MVLMNWIGYIVLGLVIGWVNHLITRKRGVKLLPSLGFAVGGALAGAFVVHLINLGGAAFFASIGAIGVLFTVNVFRKKEEPIFDESKL